MKARHKATAGNLGSLRAVRSERESLGPLETQLLSKPCRVLRTRERRSHLREAFLGDRDDGPDRGDRVLLSVSVFMDIAYRKWARRSIFYQRPYRAACTVAGKGKGKEETRHREMSFSKEQRLILVTVAKERG